jgi:hypothetical protein
VHGWFRLPTLTQVSVPYTLAQVVPGAQYLAALQAVHAASIVDGALVIVAALAEARIIDTATSEDTHWIAMFSLELLAFLLRASVEGFGY